MSRAGRVIGGIQLEKLVGRGGMGEVYLGRDLKLQRRVAVKAIGRNVRFTEAAKVRFLREARILSRLDHPNICRIYELVEHEDEKLIVLEYIEGTTLSSLDSTGLSLDRKLEIAQQVATALLVAHREGIVHRDLKPDNVMITSDGDVKVLDFGISRSVGPPLGDGPPVAPAVSSEEGGDATEGMDTDTGEGVFATALGQRLGTLRYMSPEQAAGLPVDESSDVYSFGILLQELLTGTRAYPKTVSRIELEARVASAETAPAEGLTPDLARLLEDLQQLEAEHRPSIARVLEQLRWIRDTPRRVRRRRVRFAAAALATVLLLAVVGGYAWLRIEARRSAELARELGQEVKNIEWMMRVAHTVPRHDISREKARVRARMQTLQQRVNELGRSAQGPGLYALGCGHLALGEVYTARDSLERAWELGHQTPETAYALGIALGRILQNEYSEASTAGDRQLREVRREAIRAEYTRVAELLRQLRPSELASPDYPAALVAFYEDRLDEARTLARSAFEADPWLYEAKVLEGAVLHSKAGALMDRGDATEAETVLHEAHEVMARAVAVGESAPRAYARWCLVWYRALELQHFTGQGTVDMPRAMQTCERAVEVDPEWVEGHTNLAALCERWADMQGARGEDPTPMLSRAISSTREAVRLREDLPTAHARLGSALLSRFTHGLKAGNASEEDALEAVASVQRAIELDDETALFHNTLGIAWKTLGISRQERGLDPRPAWDDAIAAYQRAVALHPELSYGYNNIGRLFVTRARYERLHGHDPRPAYQEAVTALRRAVEVNPSNTYAYNNLGDAHMALGLEQAERGGDLDASLEAALRCFEEATRLNPGYASPHNNHGLVLMHRASLALGLGEDPSADLEAAIAPLDKAASLAPSAFQPPTNLGRCAAIELEQALRHGIDHSMALARVRTHFDSALELRPNPTTAMVSLANELMVVARYDARRGSSPEPLVDEARLSLDAALAVNPAEPLALEALGELHLIRARWLLRTRASPASSLDAADAAFARALELNAHSSVALVGRAASARWRAAWRNARGHSVEQELEQGRALCAQAMSGSNNDARGLLTDAALVLLQARTAGDPSQRASLAGVARAIVRDVESPDPLIAADRAALVAEIDELLQ